MPKVDFSQVDDADDYTPVPDGKYLCRLAEVEERWTQHGDPMFSLRWEILQGEHAGRAIFDNLPFSEAALKRCKLVLGRLGVDVTGEVDVTPELLQGRTAWVTAEIEEYTDGDGRKKPRNKVPFAGYESAGPGDGDDTEVEETTEKLPF